MTENEFKFAKKHLWLAGKKDINGFKLAKILDSAYIVWPNYDKDTKDVPKIQERIYQKRKRAQKHFERLFESYHQLYWIRLSFRDDVLESTNEKTRHLYVTRLLKEKCKDYVANIDYGSKNGREHYHALVALKNPKEKFGWEYGFTTCRKVRMDTESAEKKSKTALRRYLIKFIHHATKDTAGRIFAMRGMKDIDKLPFL